jgi:hypothetical protein
MLDHAGKYRTGQLQETPDDVNREQSESKGFIRLVEYKKLLGNFRHHHNLRKERLGHSLSEGRKKSQM